MNKQLIFPMAVYVVYLWVLAVLMFSTRVRSVTSGQVPLKYFKARSGGSPPDHVLLAGRHYDNQFQVPLLFFITCLLQMHLNMATLTTLALAWGFVLSRFFHSWVMLGSNHIPTRVVAFALGWLLLLIMWIQIVFFAVQMF